MTAAFDFDRMLEAVLEAGPQDVPAATVDHALGSARTVSQRRPVIRTFDRRAWPAPRFSIANPAAHRLSLAVLVILLMLALVGTAVLLGARLLESRPSLPGLWKPIAQAPSQGEFGAAAVLQDGRVLIVGGVGLLTGAPAKPELFDPRTDTLTPPAGSFAEEGRPPTATTLRDGTVLIVGAAPTAQRFDPSSGTFRPTEPMIDPRYFHTATLLADGRVLVAGGHSFADQTSLASAEIFDPVTGSWSKTGRMAVDREQHTATLLPDGRVLVVGGANTGSPLPDAELFDPQTGAFAPASPMTVGRAAHTATLLPDGRVLIVGGVTEHDADRASSEIFDPATGLFAQTGSLVTGRYEHAATLLDDGRVLVAGGSGARGSPLSAELYDAATGTFLVAAKAAAAHVGPIARLADGRVLLASGVPELFDPGATTPIPVVPIRSDRTFVSTADPTWDRSGHTATRLPDGRVLLIGGWSPDGDASTPTSAELYDPKTGAFEATGSMSVPRGQPSDPRMGHTAVPLDDGRVLVVGGARYSWIVEIYDPLKGAFSQAGTVATESGIIKHPVSALKARDGRVVIFGPPSDAEASASTWASTGLYRWDPESSAITRFGSIPACSGVDGAVALDSEDALVLCADKAENSLVLLDSTSGQSSRIGATQGQGAESLVRLPDGRVLFTDGLGGNSLRMYDPPTERVSDVPVPLLPEIGAGLTSLSDGRVLIIDGDAATLWDPTTSVSRMLPPPIATRDSPTSTLLRDGRVLIVGGTNWPADRLDPHPAGAELFDPAALP